MTAEAAQEANDVVIGMFSINSAPATILFDSGASHSFITEQFVSEHNIPKQPMKNMLLVNSPNGEMKARYMCPRVRLDIMGVEFTSNLVVLKSEGIDVILGMDWLGAHDGVIQCAKKAVLFTSPQGDLMEFQMSPVVRKEATINQLKGKTLEDIKVVCEFPDVFPDDLPGMPPDRDFEFIIELVPGTAPISKRAYKMDVRDLAELKKQIEELLAKGYIRPSSSPWEPLLYLLIRRMVLEECVLITELLIR
ncbi:hypothetical protein FA727_23575 [Robertmurraya kyonggiensis]|uniref:Uncharacterized protein n=1 Tax=Robertmurraya kyonggiensis TaxID=1037680 RepID=A0A4U1CXY8_9BACI|nr:hypothetical protein FA727_23575 [Robertmurraya kyonggiensis]